MDELQQELNEVNEAIDRLTLLESPLIGLLPTREHQEELDTLYDRRETLGEYMSYPPDEERDNQYD